MNSRYIIAITGASGAIYGISLLKYLSGKNLEIHYTISEPGAMVIQRELGITLDLNDSASILAELGIPRCENLLYHHYKNVAAPIASGSFKTNGMAIVPCSMGTLGRIANGFSGNLVERAADVCLKERRRLILVPRETPLSKIHLKNMLAVTDAGATVLPACPGFYSNADTIQDMVDFITSRVLDHLGIDNTLIDRYGDPEMHIDPVEREEE